MAIVIQAVIIALVFARLVLRGFRRYAYHFNFRPGRFGSARYEYAAMRYSGRAEGFLLRFSVPAGVNFALWAETGFDRLCKRLGLAREAETGNAYFDRRFFFECDDPAVLAELLERDGFARLLGSFDAQMKAQGLKAAELCARGGKLEAMLTGRHTDHDKLEEQALAWLDPLVAMLGEIAPRRTRLRDRTLAPRVLHVAIWIAGLVGGAVVWILCSQRLLEAKPLFQASLPWSLAALVAALVLSYLWIGPIGRRHRALGACLLVGLPGFVLSGFLVARALDVSLPQAAPEAFPVQARLLMYDRRIGTEYRVSFNSDDVGYKSLGLSGDEYQVLSDAWGTDEKRPATLLRYPGALGAPWVEVVLPPK